MKKDIAGVLGKKKKHKTKLGWLGVSNPSQLTLLWKTQKQHTAGVNSP